MSEGTVPEGEIGATAQRDGGTQPRPGASEAEDASLVRHEETAALGKEPKELGALRARKRVETRKVSEPVPRQIEHFDDVERVAADEQDSGEVETLPDGSISIPVLEEELVVTKRTVVRERIVVRKRTETETQKVEAELRREHVDVDVDAAVDELVEREE